MTPPVQSANEILRDEAIRHAIAVVRLGNSEAKRVIEWLNREVLPEVRARIADRIREIEDRGFDRGPATTARLDQLRTEIEELAASQFSFLAEDQAGSRLPRIAAVEATAQVFAINAAISAPAPVIAGVRMSAALPPLTTIRSIIDAQPMRGAPVRQWWGELAQRYASAADKTIRRGLIEGRSPEQIIREVAGTRDDAGNLFARTRREAAAIVHTSVNDISTKVREGTFRENRHLIKGVQIIATLDTRTTPICRFQDGKVYAIDEGPRPPFHFRCRTTIVSVVKSLREMGLGSGEIAKLPAGFRASMNGIVAGDLQYYPWLKQQPASIQDEVLGPTRGRLWRSGALTADQLTDPTGGLLTLAELERRYGIKISA